MKKNIKESSNNSIIGEPKVSERSSLTISGTNCKVIIGENVKLIDVHIKLTGNNSALVIGKDCVLRGAFCASDGATINIGRKTILNWCCDFWAVEGASIIVGEYCLFSKVNIKSSDGHSIFDRSTGLRINHAKNVVVGNHVRCAQDVVILKGVNIGDGSIIGLRSVVTSSIAQHSLAVGSPAKVIRKNVDWHASQLDHSPFPLVSE